MRTTHGKFDRFKSSENRCFSCVRISHTKRVGRIYKTGSNSYDGDSIRKYGGNWSDGGKSMKAHAVLSGAPRKDNRDQAQKVNSMIIPHTIGKVEISINNDTSEHVANDIKLF